MARPERIRLGDLLVQESLITQAQLMEALAAQKTSGRKLGRMFIDNGWVDEVQIAKAVARQLRAPFIDLSTRNLRREVAALLPETHARRLRALPIEDSAVPGGPLRVAMADPTDINAYDELARLTRREIDLAVVAESQLLAALDRVYRGGDEIAGLARELTNDITTVQDEIGDLLGLGNVTTEDAPVVRLLSMMFEQALRTRASDIHIEPQERNLRIRFRIDGVLHVQTEADAKIAGAVALRLKLMSGLDISEKRLPQDGRFQAQRHRAGDLGVGLGLHMQHAVDAEANAQVALLRLDVDVRRPGSQRLLEHRRQQSHHGCVFGRDNAHAQQVADFVLDGIDVVGQLTRQAGDLVTAAVDPVERGQQLALGHHRQVDLAPGQPGQLVVGVDVGRVGHRHPQRPAGACAVLDRQRAQAPGMHLGQQCGHLAPQVAGRQVDERRPKLASDRLGDLHLGHPLPVDKNAAELAATLFLLDQGLIKLGGGEQRLLDQQVAKADAFWAGHGGAGVRGLGLG